MMTPERSTGGEEETLMDAPMGTGSYMDPVDLEDPEDPEDESPRETMEDEPSSEADPADINNSINTSVSSENCMIINESDQQHSPVPDPEGVTTMNVMVGGMNGDEVVPDSANLTPVKLDAGLLNQDTFTTSPSNSNDLHENKPSDEEDIHPLPTAREQRMRVVKCYALVAIVVLICAIGIPLAAVMLFKNNDEEASFAGATEESNSPGTDTVATVPPVDTRPPEAPFQEEEEWWTNAPTYSPTHAPTESSKEVTEPPKEATPVPEFVWEEFDDADGTTDAPIVFEDANADAELVADEFGTTDAPFLDDIDAPIIVESDATNSTSVAPLGERNVTSDMPPPATLTDAPVDMTTDEPESDTSAPTESEETVTSTPTMSPTAAPITATPTLPQTLPQTPPTTPGPDRSGIYFDLVNVTSPAILQDTSTPQALSYLWLVEKDQILPVPSGRYLLQRYILVVMDHVMHDPVRPVMSQPILDHCLWEGVVCDTETGDVKEVNWRLQGMNGRLVEEMQSLDSLERIDFSENELVGTLDNLYGASSLRHVYLHDNQFSGRLTEQVGQLENLESLYLGHNQLTGFIPLSLRTSRGGATKPLRSLILSHNQFSGYLPPDWRMRNLFYLDLGHNQLSGPLPNDWDINMVRLRHLYLDNNRFSGLLPAYFGQIGNGRLKTLYLNDNLLEGKVPENWDPKDQLTNMAVHNNNLTVPVHPSVCEMSVFEQGVMVEFRTDCDICTCDFLCEMCVE